MVTPAGLQLRTRRDEGSDGAGVEERDLAEIQDDRGDAVRGRVDDRVPELLPVVGLELAVEDERDAVLDHVCTFPCAAPRFG